MANLKLDLLNKINNEKYYKEMELVRLAQEPNMNYEEKVSKMDKLLDFISVANIKLGLIEQYFAEPQKNVTQVPVNQQPAGHVIQGQTHGE